MSKIQHITSTDLQERYSKDGLIVLASYIDNIPEFKDQKFKHSLIRDGGKSFYIIPRDQVNKALLDLHALTILEERKSQKVIPLNLVVPNARNSVANNTRLAQKKTIKVVPQKAK